MAPQKIIIDTDPGVDDVLAILMALASPEIDVSLISIVFGNTHAPVAHSNLLKIYHILAQEITASSDAATRYTRLRGETKTVLAMGEDGPVGGDKAVAAYFHGLDGLSNISETHPRFTPPVRDPNAEHEHLEISPKPAYEAILDVLRSEKSDTVTIVALGPLTNLAHALRTDPKTFSRVANVVWMGGALDHPGNTSASAEFNCFADPYAAEQIISAVKQGAFDLIMCPLDITTPHQIPFSDLIHDADTSTPIDPLRDFISAMLVRVRGLQASFGLPDAMEMHDPVAVWYAIAHAGRSTLDSAPSWATRPREFKIERRGEYTRGMCVVDRRGTDEQSGDRTQDKRLQAKVVPILPPKDENFDRMGNATDRPQRLPLVVASTPGSATLRKMLLQRVFGASV
ncbi:MAG: hypothetical protein TREMPRED_003074 [Tremellales sp. Tagirdzhanova-0007]|nr:MAG: hypothetical protein TREMPRED_003074 [Tremellales sp. Tagirdzhanova-0007]